MKILIIFLLIVPSFVFSQNKIASDTNPHPYLLDTFYYKSIGLHNFYGKTVKQLLTELKNLGFNLSSCSEFDEKEIVLGISIEYGDKDSFLKIYFEDAIKNWSRKDENYPPCNNKKIKNSKIDYFLVMYTNGTRMIVKPRNEWPKKFR